MGRTTTQQNSTARLDFNVPFFGSLDNTTDPASLADEATPDTLNTVYDSVKSVATRKGYIKVLTTPAPSFIGGLFPLYRSDGTKQLLYASGGYWYRYNNVGSGVQLTGSPASFTPDQQWDSDEFQDTMYAGNGVDPLISYNGTNISTVNAAATPQFIKIHKNRLYYAYRNSSIIYFSDAGNPASLPVNNFIQINTNDGQNISGIDSDGDDLVIFKDESVWILTGEPLGAGNTTTIGNLQLRQAQSDVGCSAFRTIQHVGNIIMFMHYTGLYYMENYSVYPVTDEALSSTFNTGMNPGFISKCWAVYSPAESKYILGYPSPTSTVCDSAVIYDTQVKGFTLWDHIPGSVAVLYKFSGSQASVVMGDPSKGNIYQMFQGYADIAGDNGTATSGTTTTLVDTTKNWTVNQFVDCRVLLGSPFGQMYTGIVQSNTATTLTFTATLPVTPTNGLIYSIGFYNNYWTTKPHDFGLIGYTKKYRFLNLFLDSVPYNLLFGFAVDFNTLSYQKNLNVAGSVRTWGQAGLVWGQSGNWGNASSTFAQANVGSNGRYFRAIFGNVFANQPWRASKYSVSYKLKKERANIVTS